MATRLAQRWALSAPTYTARTLREEYRSRNLYLIGKRTLDIMVAAVALVLLAPVMALVALAIRLDSAGPVIYSQKRVAGDQDPRSISAARQFTFFKFRTMISNADPDVHRRYMEQLIRGQAAACDCQGQKIYKLRGDPRITRVGYWLRKTSLDELPQLINVLRGEMSLVGPRPALPYEVEQYRPWHGYRLTVAQGLTGLWQVRGRNERTFDEMVELDLEYVQRRSLWLDVKILLLTVPTVLGMKGVC